MAKNELRRVVLIPNNGSVVVYYSRKGILKFSTGITISKEKKNGKFVEWDYKKNFLKTTVPDYDTKNKPLTFWQDKANKILEEKFAEGIVLTAPELKALLSKAESAQEITRSAELSKMYDQFWTRKQAYFKARKTITSLKDYTSFKHLLYDYEASLNKKIRITEVDHLFLEDLLNWMRSPRSEEPGEYQFKSKGSHSCKRR